MLLEREATLAAVADLLESAASGHGAPLFIAAEAGLGKTSVLERAVRLADGFQIGSAAGFSAEARLPFGMMTLALGRLGGGTVLEDALEASSGEARAARFYRALRWLEEESARVPILLVLDDLHWADPDSLALLVFLCRRMRDSAVAILAALRPWPAAAAEAAVDLSRPGMASVVQLQPLSQAAGVHLLQNLRGVAMGSAGATEVWRACGGNPLLLHVAADSVAEGQRLPYLEHPGSLGTKMLLARFAGVGESALRYAQAAAVYGTRFRPALVGPLAGLEEGEANEALENLYRAGLLGEVAATGHGATATPPVAGPTAPDGRAAFVHPLFAQALADDLGGLVRGRLHAMAFRLLRQAGVDPAEAAEHAVAGHLVGDPDAVATLADAGNVALRQGAIATAAGHLDAAVELAGEAAGVALLLAQAEALLLTGRLDDAQATCERVLDGGGPTGVALADAMRHLAWTSHLKGFLAQGMQHLGEAATAAAASPAHDCPAAVRVLLDCAHTSYLLVGPNLALSALADAERLAPNAGLALADEVHTYAGFISTLRADGVPGTTATVGTPGPEVPRRQSPPGASTDHIGGWGPMFGRLNMAKLTERFDEATGIYEGAITAAEHLGSPIGIVTFAVAHADTLARQGRLGEALALLDRADAWAEFTPVVTPWTMALRAVFLTEADRAEEAASCCDGIDELGPMLDGYMPLVWLWQWTARCRLLLAGGSASQASDLARRVAGLAASCGLREPCTVPWASVALDAHTVAGRLDDVELLVSWLEEVVLRLPCRWPRAVAARGRAVLAEKAGDLTQAMWHHRDGIALLEPVGLPLALAESLVAYGTFLRRSGRPSEARSPLRRATELADKAGAGRLSCLAASELAATGGRRSRRKPASVLTPQEERVAALAAEGMTNRQIADVLFLSAKTVDHHLSRAYSKLGVTSRRDLMRKGPDTSPTP
ncbi:MAG: helix-turn-helix transcriptional regulator [Acidimicrobiales bacterium]